MPYPAIVPAELELTPEGIPYSTTFADIYHAQDGGLAQAEHVFLAGNQLPSRWQGKAHFSICETGFGLGLSFLATWAKWRTDPARSQRLHFVSCELHPFRIADLQQLHAGLFAKRPDLLELSQQLLEQWPLLLPGLHRLELDGGRVALTLLLGNALDWLPKLVARIDAFYLDGFAPAKNPQLWQHRLFKQVSRLSAEGATLATYTAVGEVRRGLEAVGFEMQRAAGFAGKRHMLVGRFRSPRAPLAAPQDRRAIIIGAGLAGASLAERLACRGWQITLLERHPQPAQEASGNHAGVYRPVVSTDDNLQARLARAAFLYGLRRLADTPQANWAASGVLQLARNPAEAERFERLAVQQAWPADYLRFVSQAEASALAGAPAAASGLWFPGGAWINPPSLVQAQLAAASSAVELRYQVAVASLSYRDEQWLALDAAGQELARAPVLVLANAADANRFAPELALGSDERWVSHLPTQAAPAIQAVVCCGGYLTPSWQGTACLGSSAFGDDADAASAANAANLDLLAGMLPATAIPLDVSQIKGRHCARPVTIDRLPIAGAVADAARFQVKHAGSLHLAPRQPGLYALTGFGARGLVWSGLLAELLASQIEGEPLPIERELVNAVDPARFLGRQRERSNLAEP